MDRKMDKNYTHLVLIIDRSGSMQSMKNDAMGGINELIESQKKEKGKTTITLAEFDEEYNCVHDFIDISEAKKYSLFPRGGTALLDAVGKTLNVVGSKLEALPEKKRPSLVNVTIVTDGEENSSKEFDQKTISEMIKNQTDVYNWKFSYLGANQDSFTAAKKMGISFNGVANYKDVRATYGAESAKINRMRTASMHGLNVDNSFTDDEIKSMGN